MKVLLIESTPGNATAIQADLLADGHEVLSCSDDRGGPCRGTANHAECPLEHHVDLTIVTREQGSSHTLAEMGSVCSTRHRVPMVVVDPSQVDDEMPSVTVANAVAKRSVEAGYAAAIRHELGHLPALVDVERSPNRIHVSVQVPAAQGSAVKLSAIADRARHAVRAHDPYVDGIDVSVVCYPDVE